MPNWMLGFGALLALAACDDGAITDGSGRRTLRGDGADDEQTPGAGPIGGGADDSRELSSLSDDESVAFCEWLAGLEDRSLTNEQYCTQEASEEAESSSDCEDLRDACIDDAAAEDDEELDCEGTSFPSACSARVGEFKSCLRDLVELVSVSVRRATCDDPELGRRPDALPSTCDGIPDDCFDF